jgi:hypothetical protein
VRDILTSFIETQDSEDDDKGSDKDEVMCNTVASSRDPPNYAAEIKTPQAEQWRIAIESALKSLRENRTWIVVERPVNVKPIASRLVFKLKLDTDGAIERYKARLVARGDQQIEGDNYQDTFFPVMDMATARIIFAFGAI